MSRRRGISTSGRKKGRKGSEAASISSSVRPSRNRIGPIGVPETLPVVADLNAIKGDEFYIGGGRLGRKYVITRQELVAVVDQNVVEIYVPIE